MLAPGPGAAAKLSARISALEAALGADGQTRPGQDCSLPVSVGGSGLRGCRVLGRRRRLSVQVLPLLAPPLGPGSPPRPEAMGRSAADRAQEHASMRPCIHPSILPSSFPGSRDADRCPPAMHSFPTFLQHFLAY